MKVVLLGNYNVQYTSERHWAKSIERLGHSVVRLQEGITPADVVLSEASEADAFIWVHTHGWETPGSITMSDVLKRLKSFNIPSIAYHLDLYMGLERWKEYESNPYLSEVEYFFTVDKFMADWLNENTETKAHYIPAGVFGEECTMPAPQRVGYDIVFTGSKNYHKEYPYRPLLIDFLTKTYGKKFIHIGNDGEVPAKRGNELNQIYRNAKIVIGDTLQLNFDYPYYYSDRLFEVPGRSGFQIFPDIKGVEDNYEDGKEIVLYRHGDLDDLKAKIDYYLSRPLEREAIRKAGFDRTIKDHTYVNRWKQILDTVFGGEK